MTRRAKSLVLLAVKLLLAAGLLAWVFSSETMRNMGWSGLVDRIGQWPWVVTAFLMVCLIPLIGAMRWHLLLKCVGCTLPFSRTLHLTLTGTFFNCLGLGYAGGDVTKAYYVMRGRARGRRAEALYATVFDRVIGLFSLLLAGTAVLLTNLSEVWQDQVMRIALQVMGIAVAVFVVGFTFVRPGPIQVGPGGLPADDARARGGLLRRLYLSLQRYRKSYRVVLTAIGLSMAAHAVTIGTLFLLGRALGMPAIGTARFVFYAMAGLAFSSVGPLMGVGFGQFAFAELFKYEWPESGYQFGVLLATVYQLTVLGCNMLLGLPAFLSLRRQPAGAGDGAEGQAAPDPPCCPEQEHLPR